MENNKYYTPSINEIHSGFIIEALHSNDFYFDELSNGWTEIELSLYDLSRQFNLITLYEAIIRKWIRVKCLDKEDIELFGFEFKKHNGINTFVKDHFYINWFDSEKKSEVVGIYAYDKSIDYESQLFRGIIKNKSELKFILTRLGII